MPFRRTSSKAKAATIGFALTPKLIIVGLGNPGPEYARSRHNVGFMCIDWLSKEHSIDVAERRRYVTLGEGQVEGQPVVLAKPRTFVNRSGQAVHYLLNRYRVKADTLLVIYDDMDLPPGKIRLRPKGSAGGHNGLKSIIESIATTEFPRVRVGIGHPPEEIDPVGHVLGRFSSEEEAAIRQQVAQVGQAVAAILKDGLEKAMTQFN